ncbi:hypothetical protein HMP09_2650 [Sphingomonas sp. HMP9]|uniref:oligosaccharide flippase family protein n=1 Tax=Sphingomonas sp. HMP9 TaxID=1517554 RepID=UPI001597110E|nr:oligosaccharide flippase family protein [Sphingomonas sp. HMP9]BCA63416.1 hypothetical protein HMP09_2650 [Sphingomonas sp. HMP9]
MTYSRIAITGIVWQFLQIAADRVTQALVFLIVAKVIGPREFGFAALATTAAVIVMTTLQAGSQIVVQRKEVDETFLNSIFSLMAWLGGLSSLVMVVICAIFYNIGDLREIGLLMLPTMLVPLATAFGVVPDGLLMRTFAYRRLVVRRSVGQVAAGALCCWLALAGAGAWSIVLQVTLAPIVSTVISVLSTSWRPRFARGGLRGLAGISSDILGMAALTQVNIRSADVIVGAFVGPAAIGVFRLSRVALDMVTGFVLNPVNNTLLPIFSRMEDQRERAIEAMWQVCRSMTVVATLPMVVMPFAGPYLVSVALGGKWSELTGTTAILLGALPLIAVASPLSSFLVAFGSSRLALKNNLWQLLLNVVFLAIGAMFNIYVAAAAFVLRCFVGFVGLTLVLQRHNSSVRASTALSTLAPVPAGAAVILAVEGLVKVLGLDLNTIGGAILATLLACTTYFAVAFLLFGARVLEVARRVLKRPEQLQARG